MISYKGPSSRRTKLLKMPKNIEQLYKQGKCTECSVVVTRMDFARICGKFTKVKIQYESTATPKTKKNVQNNVSPSSNARLKSNENGMVLIHRNAYNEHPVSVLLNKKGQTNDKTTRVNNNTTKSKNNEVARPNILRENNRLKKAGPIRKDIDKNIKRTTTSIKRYRVVFTNPVNGCIKDQETNLTLLDLLPSINQHMLPSADWSIHFLPLDGEPKEDKVYDRIAAELEDLMYNERSTDKAPKTDTDNKDDFPSIMDILNDNTADSVRDRSQNNPIVQSNLESSDVEAMLLGKSSESPVKQESAMEADNSVVNNLMDVVDVTPAKVETNTTENNNLENPNSPSILNETLLEGAEEHLPKVNVRVSSDIVATAEPQTENKLDNIITQKPVETPEVKVTSITHVVFRKHLNSVCVKSVTCPKSLKYSVELEGKSVEFLGAPKHVSNAEDLKVLLQIVNETELSSVYILH